MIKIKISNVKYCILYCVCIWQGARRGVELVGVILKRSSAGQVLSIYVLNPMFSALIIHLFHGLFL